MSKDHDYKPLRMTLVDAFIEGVSKLSGADFVKLFAKLPCKEFKEKGVSEELRQWVYRLMFPEADEVDGS